MWLYRSEMEDQPERHEGMAFRMPAPARDNSDCPEFGHRRYLWPGYYAPNHGRAPQFLQRPRISPLHRIAREKDQRTLSRARSMAACNSSRKCSNSSRRLSRSSKVSLRFSSMRVMSTSRIYNFDDVVNRAHGKSASIIQSFVRNTIMACAQANRQNMVGVGRIRRVQQAHTLFS